MMSIVLCHFFQYYNIELAWWFNVGVQIFFTISGFLYGRREINDPVDFILKRLKRILVPYYAFLLPALLCYVIFHRESLSLIHIAGSLVCSHTVDGLGNLWFVSYILFCYLITPYLYSISKKLKKLSFINETAIIAVILLSIQILGYAYSSYFNPAWITCYIVGYFIAYYFGKYRDKALKNILIICAPLCMISCSLRVYFSYIFTGNLSAVFDKLISVFIIYSRSLLGITLFLMMYVLLYNAEISKKIGKMKLINEFDTCSYSIYLVHQMFILSPFTCLTLTKSAPINCAIALMVIAVVAYIHNYVTDILIGHPKKLEMKT